MLQMIQMLTLWGTCSAGAPDAQVGFHFFTTKAQRARRKRKEIRSTVGNERGNERFYARREMLPFGSNFLGFLGYWDYLWYLSGMAENWGIAGKPRWEGVVNYGSGSIRDMILGDG
jgi:hypothetical protein